MGLRWGGRVAHRIGRETVVYMDRQIVSESVQWAVETHREI